MEPNKTKIDFSDRPITIDGTEVKSLEMREPTVGDQLAVDKLSSAAEKEVAMFANLCEIAPATLHGLSIKQYGKLQDAYADFTS